MDNNIVDKIELLALQVYPKDEFYIDPGVLFDQKERDRNKWIEGYKAAQIKQKPIKDSLLEALKNIVQDIEHYGEVKMRPSSTAINQAKAAIQKAEQ